MNRPLREISHGGFLKALSTISPTSSTPGASCGGSAGEAAIAAEGAAAAGAAPGAAAPGPPARTALRFARTDARRGSAARPRGCAAESFVVVMVRRRHGT